jgi:hypothetical protein
MLAIDQVFFKAWVMNSFNQQELLRMKINITSSFSNVARGGNPLFIASATSAA